MADPAPEPDPLLAGIRRYNAAIDNVNQVLPYLLSDPIISNLRKLYPDLPNEPFFGKFEEVTDAFGLFRTFVPFYYSLDLAGKHDLIKTLLPYVGWCAGDPHMENFGAFYQDPDSSAFTINDIDDSCTAPLVTDAMRFFVSVLLAGKPISDEQFKTIVEAYVNGLRAEEFTNDAEEVKRARDESAEKKWDAKKKDFDADPLKVEIVRDDPAGVWNIIQEEIGAKYAGWTLTRVMQDKRKKGGSGGLLRFVTMLEKTDGAKKKTRIIEFKEEPAHTGVYPLIKAINDGATAAVAPASAPEPAPAPAPAPLPVGTFVSRLPQSKAHILQDVDVSLYLSATLSFFNGPAKQFLLRPRYKSNEGVKLENVTSVDELVLLAQYEAWTLGKIHARTASIVADIAYADAVDAFSAAKWQAVAKGIAKVMQDTFDAL